MSRTVRISELMAKSGVQFGTSGARGLVTAMTDEVCAAYTQAFVQHVTQTGAFPKRVAVAGDRRPSTARIMNAVMRGIVDAGSEPVNCGDIPSPAVALYGLVERIPAIMVTGSHIPDDRNGIKFNTPAGEILKADEIGIKAQAVELADHFDESGGLRESAAFRTPPVEAAAAERYVERYLKAFSPRDFAGRRLGVYGHSAVGRELLVELLSKLGAEVVRLGWSETFVPVDTEAIREQDVELAAKWAREHALECIVSTDGDSDRPLVSDENGKWLRGDVAGIVCAQYLGATVVVTPVSCNSAVEKSGFFEQVIRTRIGSPYVIEAMQKAATPSARVVGYEANGGFLTGTDIALEAGNLPALSTRDPIVVMLSVLSQAARKKRKISALLSELPARFTASDRLQNFPSETSQAKLRALSEGGAAAIESLFGPSFGKVSDINEIDGLRITFDSADVLHLRASGNAPELRCYSESSTEEQALALNRSALAILETWR